MVVTSSDSRGLHILVADEASGYAWRTAATLAEEGVDADTWVGNVCTTPDGRYAVAAYLPRVATNDQASFDHGAFVATVDLDTGRVRRLPLTASLAYFSPACGPGGQAVVSSFDHGAATTDIFRVDIQRASVDDPIQVPGELTSAIPAADGTIVAADGNTIVRLNGNGARSILATTESAPFRLVTDAAGGVSFMVAHGTKAVIRHLSLKNPGAGAAFVADGALDRLSLVRSTGGQPAVFGRVDRVADRRGQVRIVSGSLPYSQLSTRGHLLVRQVRPAANVAVGEARGVRILARSTVTGSLLRFATRPKSPATGGATPDPATVRSAAGRPSGAGRRVTSPATSSHPVDPDRTCSVPRNDPRNQVMQPKPRQVEWAVDQAVRDRLTVRRPANWKNLGMPEYTPQGLFPSRPLVGGGKVPAQVLLGIIAQESNMWQATGQVLPGVTGNPLIGNYYGREIYDGDARNDWIINFGRADCGYGVSQVTDGMRLAGREKPGETALPYNSQRAVALDFAANVAAGLRILQDKWNQTRSAGLIINDGDPSRIENWFYAVWAYNTGFYPEADKAKNQGAWGVGWSNNPANPKYPANRAAFLDRDYADAARPQLWPYPEKVMGWAGHPVEILESPGKLVPGFRAAYWNGTSATGPLNRSRVKPPVTQFCDLSNSCEPGAGYLPNDPSTVGEPAGPCAHKNSSGRYDLRCWYHAPSTWKPDCATTCGRELLRFDPGYAYQDDGNSYPPNCGTSGLPAGALVVDDLPDDVAAVRSGCSRRATNSGTFTLRFASDSTGAYPSKADFHQLGAGFNGHFWFAHTRQKDLRQGSMDVTGTWTLNRPLRQWARVLVHLPDHGAHTQQARYLIDTGSGISHRVIPQRVQANKWISLGVFAFAGTPRVILSSATNDGDSQDDIDHDTVESEDIAFDAVAFQPLPRKPAHIVVSLGDSYSSGEGASASGGTDYFPETDYGGTDPDAQNACHRSVYAWPRLLSLTGLGSQIGEAADRFATNVEQSFLACSGARTENLLPLVDAQGEPRRNAFGRPGTSNWGELSQLDRGFLDTSTTLVTLSIGGNDARFGDVIAECMALAGWKQCQDAKLKGSSVPASQEVPDLIDGKVKRSIGLVLDQIHRAAPNAKIVLVGYPRLIDRNGECLRAGAINLIGKVEADWLDAMADRLATRMREATREANSVASRPFAWFADPRATFDGKGVCGIPERIHGIVARRTPGETRSVLQSQQSFHPKIAGQTLYAQAVNATLRAMGL